MTLRGWARHSIGTVLRKVPRHVRQRRPSTDSAASVEDSQNLEHDGSEEPLSGRSEPLSPSREPEEPDVGDTDIGLRTRSPRSPRPQSPRPTEGEIAGKPKLTRHRTVADLGDVDELPQSITGQICLCDTAEKKIFGMEAAMSEDAYGAAVVAIVRNATVISMKLEQGFPIMFSNVSRMAFAGMSTILNLVMQVSMLWYIQTYIVRINVHSVQSLYAHFSEHYIREDGTLDAEEWLAAPRDEQWEICGISMWNKAFYYSILFLWALTNLSEFRSIERLCRQLWYIPHCDMGKEMLYFIDRAAFQAGGSCYIIALTPKIRAVVFGFVVLPRTLIALALLFLGWMWLSASKCFEDMVMNSLALEFVIHIDELLYYSILPLMARKQINETKFFITDHEMITLETVEKRERDGYKRTMVWLLIILILMFTYGEVLQDVLPPTMHVVAHACEKFLREHDKPLCTKYAFQLRSAKDECYARRSFAEG